MRTAVVPQPTGLLYIAILVKPCWQRTEQCTVQQIQSYIESVVRRISFILRFVVQQSQQQHSDINTFLFKYRNGRVLSVIANRVIRDSVASAVGGDCLLANVFLYWQQQQQQQQQQCCSRLVVAS